MPVTVIPFKMPEPAQIPSHIIDDLRSLTIDDAVLKSMDLLMQIEVADIILYERIGNNVVSVVGERGEEIKKIIDSADGSLYEFANVQDSSVLIMGQVELSDSDPLPNGVTTFLLGGGDSGSIGFNYILPLTDMNGKGLGALTLMRSVGLGPLNHEQPNICEAIRLELGARLASES